MTEAVTTRAQRRAAWLRLLTPHSQPALDALRGLAALAIVVKHVGFQTGAAENGVLGAVTSRLDVGVAVFFVLSGYLLTAPHVAAAGQDTARPGARRYFWHRALRILPAYWVACAAALLLVPGNHGVAASTAIRNLALAQIYRPGDLLQGFTQTWSLCTEVVFYLMLPALSAGLIWSLRRHQTGSAVLVVGLLVLANLVFLVAVHTSGVYARSTSAYWLPAYTSWFAGGMALAVARRGAVGPALRLRAWLDAAAAAPAACWTIATATLLLSTTTVAGPIGFEAPSTAGQDVAKNLLYLVIALCLTVPLAFGDAQPSRLRRHFTGTAWRYLGEISYGVFLWHLIMLAWVVHWRGDATFGGDFWVTLLLTLMGSLFVATLSLFVIERPFLRLKDAGPGRPPVQSDGAETSTGSGLEDGATTAAAASAPPTQS